MIFCRVGIVGIDSNPPTPEVHSQSQNLSQSSFDSQDEVHWRMQLLLISYVQASQTFFNFTRPSLNSQQGHSSTYDSQRISSKHSASQQSSPHTSLNRIGSPLSTEQLTQLGELQSASSKLKGSSDSAY